MSPKTDISLTIIARDAADTIGKCIDSAKTLTNDVILVVDKRTKDQTAEIGKKFGAQVFIRDFDDFSGQKNFAVSKTRHDWTLSLDADEWIGEDLKNEILDLDLSVGPTSYAIPRKNIIFGRIINHTNWDPNGIVRLFKKSSGHWQGKVHEQVITGGEVFNLRFPMFHLNYSSVEEFLTRQDVYSTAEAQEKFLSGYKSTPLKAILVSKYEFFRRYIWHAGFLDGWHGLFLSYLMSMYHFSVHVKLWQKSHHLKV